MIGIEHYLVVSSILFVMGVLGIEFMWYVRRMALPALLGYVGGILTYWLTNP